MHKEVVRKIHRDLRKRTWLARELNLSIRVITDIKSMPLEQAVEKYCT